ncbi:spore germination protein [Sulfobacillus thermosulfidooxidans DSM 9293]|uniref:Spore germination protein n=2 Tax=Sulfobacillus thermosulfidooxidans TaxID=28034 RepID=A0A1W1W8P1_SULTA|nr:GerAB/ArcD/ProY family transporter [Sulfobacillus thermosulfidooxidans]SMC02562.1 spore germination protein [Sulfobacillus thermosulfidooxidans DSM 9293]
MDFGKSQRLPRISGLQFGTVVTAGYMAMGIFYFPREMVTAAGRDAIWSFWLEGLVTYFLMRLTFAMNRLVPNETLGEFAPKIVSTPIGLLIGLYTVVYHLALAIVAAVLFGYVLSNIFLPDTPVWGVTGALVLASLYIASLGISSLARTLQSGYIPMVLLTILTLVLAMGVIRHPVLLEPPVNIQVIPILQGAYREYFLFIGFEVSVTLYPFIRNEERRKGERFAYLGLLLMVFIGTIMYEATMATFGPAFIPIMRWPVVSLMRILAVNGFFISKWGMLVVVLWTIAVVAFIAIRLWCLAHDMAAMIHWHSRYSYPTFLLIGAIIIFVFSIWIPNAKITDYITQTFLLPLGFLYLLGIPLLILTVAHFRKPTVRKLRQKTEPEPPTPG